MKEYLNLLDEVLSEGTRQSNRTGIDTITIPGAMVRYNMTKGFPAVTTKKLPFKSVAGELCAFLRASSSSDDFVKMGCKVWDQNANEHGKDLNGNQVENKWLSNPYRRGHSDLGSIYGVQWRKWPGFTSLNASLPNLKELVGNAEAKGWSCLGVTDQEYIYAKEIDQLRLCLDTIVNNPHDRRIIFHAWNPAALDLGEMALPPCHLLYQFLPNAANKTISMCLYIRSNDLGLGHPFNAAEAAMMLALVGRLTGYEPKFVTVFMSDAHIYLNHIEPLKEQMAREPFAPPKLVINDHVPEFHRDGYHPEWLNLVEPSDFTLDSYQCHEAIKMDMAV